MRFRAEEAHLAGAMRLLAGVEVLVVGEERGAKREGREEKHGEVWLRGMSLDEATEAELRKAPCAARYFVRGEDRLLAWGERVPSGRLPEGDWRPIAEWVRPEPQAPASAGTPAGRVTPRVVRSSEEREAALLVVAEAKWLEYASTAPAARLKPLVFALSADGRVLVRGTPLPPLPGTRCSEADGVAVPCGFAIDPPVDAAVLREALDLGPGELALFDERGGWERVSREAFVKATRSAVRMSKTQ